MSRPIISHLCQPCAECCSGDTKGRCEYCTEGQELVIVSNGKKNNRSWFIIYPCFIHLSIYPAIIYPFFPSKFTCSLWLDLLSDGYPWISMWNSSVLHGNLLHHRLHEARLHGANQLEKKAPTGDFFGILNVTKCQSFSDFYSTFMTFKKMFHNLFQRSAGHEREPNFPPASVFRPLQLNRSKNWKGTVRQPFCQSTYSLQGVFYCFRIQAAATQTFKLWTFQDNVWHAVRMPLTVKTCSSIVWRIFSHKRGNCSTAFAGSIDSPDLEMMYAIFFYT